MTTTMSSSEANASSDDAEAEATTGRVGHHREREPLPRHGIRIGRPIGVHTQAARTVRLLRMLERAAPGAVTWEHVAKSLGCSTRTARRDAQALIEAGERIAMGDGGASLLVGDGGGGQSPLPQSASEPPMPCAWCGGEAARFVVDEYDGVVEPACAACASMGPTA